MKKILGLTVIFFLAGSVPATLCATLVSEKSAGEADASAETQTEAKTKTETRTETKTKTKAKENSKQATKAKTAAQAAVTREAASVGSRSRGYTRRFRLSDSGKKKKSNPFDAEAPWTKSPSANDPWSSGAKS